MNRAKLTFLEYTRIYYIWMLNINSVNIQLKYRLLLVWQLVDSWLVVTPKEVTASFSDANWRTYHGEDFCQYKPVMLTYRILIV